MKKVSILIPEGDISLSNVEGVHHILTEANKWLEQEGIEKGFNIQMVGKYQANFMKDGFFSVHPTYLTNEAVESDLLIIPALHTDVRKGLEKNLDLLPWIVDQYKSGAEVMSLCTGAFLLAATGLLNGKSCTTHWFHARELQSLHPEVKVLYDDIMTDENGLYTSGAAYSYMNLLLYVIEKYAGRSLVLFLSKVFAVDISRKSQAEFMIFDGFKNHIDEEVLKIQGYIEQEFDQNIRVNELTEIAKLGRRTLERRFKAATGVSIINYLQNVRVEAAKKQFEMNSSSISEVMYQVGYSDTKAFRERFKKVTGLTPFEYKNKYHIDNPAKHYKSHTAT